MEAGERIDANAAECARPDHQSAAPRLPELRARVGSGSPSDQPIILVIPAKAGIHGGMDPGFRRDDNDMVGGSPLMTGAAIRTAHDSQTNRRGRARRRCRAWLPG